MPRGCFGKMFEHTEEYYDKKCYFCDDCQDCVTPSEIRDWNKKAKLEQEMRGITK